MEHGIYKPMNRNVKNEIIKYSLMSQRKNEKPKSTYKIEVYLLPNDTRIFKNIIVLVRKRINKYRYKNFSSNEVGNSTLYFRIYLRFLCNNQ